MILKKFFINLFVLILLFVSANKSFALIDLDFSGVGGVSSAFSISEKGDVWLLSGAGLSRMSYDSFSLKYDNLILGDFEDFTIDSDGVFWLYNLDSLYRFDGDEYEEIVGFEGVINDVEYYNGGIYIATSKDTYKYLDGLISRAFLSSSVIASNSLDVSDGSLYVSVFKNGFIKVVGAKAVHYSLSDNSLLSNSVRLHLMIDEVLRSFYANGVLYLVGKDYVAYSDDFYWSYSSLGDGVVVNNIIESEGGVWIVTNQGLFRLYKGQWLRVTNYALSVNDVFFSGRYLWLASDDGVAWFDVLNNRLSDVVGFSAVPGDSFVELFWEGVSSEDSVLGYILYQSVDGGDTYDDGFFISDVSTSSLRVENLKNDIEYTFMLKSYGVFGTESYGASASTIPSDDLVPIPLVVFDDDVIEASIGKEVRLDASSSVIYSPSYFEWTFISGPKSGFNSFLGRGDVVRFFPKKAGEYAFDLRIVGSRGELSDVGRVVVNASNPLRPFADAGDDVVTRVGELVSLSSRGSVAYMDSIYRWSVVRHPKDGWTGFENADPLSPVFIPKKPGRYVFELVLIDSFGQESSVDSVSVSVSDNYSLFLDLPDSHWSYDFFKNFYDSGVVEGYSDGYVRPFSEITKYEFLKILLLSAGSDVLLFEGESWRRVYFDHATSLGLIEGDYVMFDGDSHISRYEVVDILSRYFSWGGECYSVSLFSDVDVSDPLCGKLSFAKNSNIISGFENGSFKPSSLVKRSEALKMVDRSLYFDLFKD